MKRSGDIITAADMNRVIDGVTSRLQGGRGMIVRRMGNNAIIEKQQGIIPPTGPITGTPIYYGDDNIWLQDDTGVTYGGSARPTIHIVRNSGGLVKRFLGSPGMLCGVRGKLYNAVPGQTPYMCDGSYVWLVDSATLGSITTLDCFNNNGVRTANITLPVAIGYMYSATSGYLWFRSNAADSWKHYCYYKDGTQTGSATALGTSTNDMSVSYASHLWDIADSTVRVYDTTMALTGSFTAIYSGDPASQNAMISNNRFWDYDGATRIFTGKTTAGGTFGSGTFLVGAAYGLRVSDAASEIIWGLTYSGGGVATCYSFDNAGTSIGTVVSPYSNATLVAGGDHMWIQNTSGDYTLKVYDTTGALTATIALTASDSIIRGNGATGGYAQNVKGDRFYCYNSSTTMLTIYNYDGTTIGSFKIA